MTVAGIRCRHPEATPREQRDVLAVVRVQGPRLDHAYLRRNAPLLMVADLLDRALREGTA